MIAKVSRLEGYILKALERKELAHPWNGEHLKKYFQ